MKYLIILLPLLLCACAGRWVRYDGSADIKDLRECQWETTKITAAIEDAAKQGWMEAQVYRECLTARGYYFQRD